MTSTRGTNRTSTPTLVWLALAVIALHLIAAVALNYPGHMSVDSIVQLGEARSGNYVSFHPPFTTWLLGLADAVVKGTGLYVIVNSAVHAASFAWLVRLMPRVTWPGIVVLIVWAIWPVTVIYDGIVWKDVLFANISMLGASATMAYVYSPSRLRLLTVIVVSAVLLLIRQHGLLISVFFCLCASAFPIAKTQINTSIQRRVWRAITLVFAMLLISQVILFAVMLSLNTQPSRSTSAGLILLMVYDIAGLLSNAPSLLPAELVHFTQAKVDVPKLLLEMRGTYAAARIDSLTPTALWAVAPDNPDMFSLVSKQWWQLILNEPLAYLSHRADAFSWALGLRDQAQCLPIHLGTVPEPRALVSALALTQGVSPYSHQLYLYAKPLINTPVFAPASYCAAIVVIMLSLVRTWREHVVALGLGAGCLLFCLAYLVIGLACDFRYMYVAVPAAFWLLYYRVSLKPAEQR